MKTIAILLTCHNRKAKTLHCLKALYNCEVPRNYTFDVFLVDDGSTDGTAEAINIEYPNVNIINGNGNLYWNRGMYKAWQSSVKQKDYDFYLWLNDDTELKNYAIKVLIESSNMMLHKAIIVGSTIDENGLNSYGGWNNTRLIVPNNELQKCNYFNGNIVLLPRYVFDLVGFNDPIFHHSLGDFDYGLRARKKDIESFVAAQVLGVCNGHKTFAKWCNPEVNLFARWKAFRTPLGHNPEEFFVYEYRHNGIIIAIFHYLTNHLRVILPSLWGNKTK